MRYQASPDVLAAPLVGETVLLHMASKRYFRLNATAQRSWELLEAGASRDQLLATLLAEYDAGVDEVAAALDELIARLRASDLVQPVDREP